MLTEKMLLDISRTKIQKNSNNDKIASTTPARENTDLRCNTCRYFELVPNDLTDNGNNTNAFCAELMVTLPHFFIDRKSGVVTPPSYCPKIIFSLDPIEKFKAERLLIATRNLNNNK